MVEPVEPVVLEEVQLELLAVTVEPVEPVVLED
jgi:hypothetical protein